MGKKDVEKEKQKEKEDTTLGPPASAILTYFRHRFPHKLLFEEKILWLKRKIWEPFPRLLYKILNNITNSIFDSSYIKVIGYSSYHSFCDQHWMETEDIILDHCSLKRHFYGKLK